MKFETKAHLDKEGRWTGQVLLAGVVVHEDSGNVTESQARANVETSFAGWLSGAIDREIALETAEFDAEHA